jgi:hypothetical protein
VAFLCPRLDYSNDKRDQLLVPISYTEAIEMPKETLTNVFLICTKALGAEMTAIRVSLLHPKSSSCASTSAVAVEYCLNCESYPDNERQFPSYPELGCIPIFSKERVHIEDLR